MSTLVKILRPDLYTEEDITPATLLSAGLDLKLAEPRAANTQLVAEGMAYPRNDLIGTGLAVAIPPGYVGLLLPRSSAGHKRNFRLANTAGVIDSDYRGEIKLSVPIQCGDLKEGEVLAQLIVVACDSYFKVVDELGTTERGDGGFGSTTKVEEFNDKVAALLKPDEPDELAVECPYCAWTGYTHELEGANGNWCPECHAIVLVGGVDDE